MGGFLTPIMTGAAAAAAPTGGRLLSNPRGRTLGWIGLFALLKELFNAAAIT